MSVNKDEYAQRTVVENGNVVTYAIPHGRLHPEIISMTPLSDDQLIIDKQAEVQESVDQANQDVEQQKYKDAETTQQILADDSTEKDAAKSAQVSEKKSEA